MHLFVVGCDGGIVSHRVLEDGLQVLLQQVPARVVPVFKPRQHGLEIHGPLNDSGVPRRLHRIAISEFVTIAKKSDAAR